MSETLSCVQVQCLVTSNTQALTTKTNQEFVANFALDHLAMLPHHIACIRHAQQVAMPLDHSQNSLADGPKHI